MLGGVDRDLGAGVATADDEHVEAGEVVTATVVVRHHHPAGELPDAGQLDLARRVVEAGGDDGVGGGEHRAVVEGERPGQPVGGTVDPRHRGAQPHVEPVMSGVELEVAHHVVTCDPPAHLLGDRQARQARELTRGMQPEPVVVPAPRAADAGLPLEHDGVQAALPHRGRDREPGRAGADDVGVDGDRRRGDLRTDDRGTDDRSADDRGSGRTGLGHRPNLPTRTRCGPRASIGGPIAQFAAWFDARCAAW